MRSIASGRFSRALLALSAFLLLVPIAAADSGSPYTLPWWTVDAGGSTLARSGPYSVSSTIGQPDAGILSSGDYTLLGGFWGGVAATYRIYLPLVLRSAQKSGPDVHQP